MMYLIALLIFVYLLARKLLGAKTRKLAPVAAGGWPIVGHVPALAGAPRIHVALGEMADKNGPIYTLNLGLNKTVVVSSHELAEECFTKNDAVLSSRPKFAAAKYLTYNYATFAFGPPGAYWRDVRRIASSELLSKRRLEAMRRLQACEVETSLKELRASWSERKDRHDASGRVPVSMKEWFSNLSLNIMVTMVGGRRFAGVDADPKARRWRRLVREFFTLLGAVPPSDAFPFLERLDLGGHIGAMKGTARELDAMLGEWLEEHRRRRSAGGEVAEGEKDFMDVMIEELDGKERLGDYDADTVIKATCLGMVAGGTDSTSILLTWVIALLLNHPQALNKVKQELHTHINDSTSSIKDLDISKLVYLQAVVKETLRLYPSGPLVPRVCTDDCTVAGYHVSKGTRVIINNWKIQRDPRVWPDPLEFKPERFLTTHADVDVRGMNYELIPFGSGRRGCPGLLFALQMALLTLASFLHEFEISSPSNEPVDLTAKIGLPNMIESPLEILVKPRVSS